nr:glycosyltransferase family 4 protein [Bradyrhizobium vignae]
MISVVKALTAGCRLLFIGHINLLPLALVARLLNPRIKLVLFVHGDEAWNDALQRKKRWYEPTLLSTVDCIASVSNFTAQTMAKEFGVEPNKFRLLPNAVDPIRRLSAAGNRAQPTILTVSRLGQRDRLKNVHQMIRAVAELRNAFPTIRYEIVGDGPMRKELEALAGALGVSDIVHFLGRLTDQELDEAYSRATVFALPSSKEGFGIVYLEAWQRALPVICSSAGASKEIVSDGIDGFVVNPGNVSEITNRLHQLLSRPELAASMGESGRQKVDANYMNDTFRSNLDKIVTELLADQSHPSAGALMSQRTALD